MASDTGVVKIGISGVPRYRFLALRQKWKSFKRISYGWGLSRADAVMIEKIVHERLSDRAIGNELFKVSEKTAVALVNHVLNEKGLTFIPLTMTSIPRRKTRDVIPRKTSGKPAKKSFSLMLDEEIRAKAERFAKEQDRSLGWWINSLMEREVRSLEALHPSRARRGREPVTDRHRAA